MTWKILSVVGARPNFMKIAPLLRALSKVPEVRSTLVHTGQHYDLQLSRQFFLELQLPEPDVNLEVGSASHGVQTGEMMKRLEPVLQAEQPDLVVVVGDVNSTLAAALVAAKLQIPLAHVEAGLRSFDRRMPEEINRVVTDALSELLLVTEPAGLTCLAQEGIPATKAHLVGDLQIDCLASMLPTALKESAGLRGTVPAGGFALVTLHRPSNVDDPHQLRGVVDALVNLSNILPVLFPVHPRTRSRLESAGLYQYLEGLSNLRLLPPLGYLAFQGLLSASRLVVTDSGGIQAEATWLRVPCLTLRDTTERPQTVEVGANRLLGTDPRDILPAVHETLTRPLPGPLPPPLMDGMAATRIVPILLEFLQTRRPHA